MESHENPQLRNIEERLRQIEGNTGGLDLGLFVLIAAVASIAVKLWFFS